MITYSIIQKSQLEGAKRIDAEYFNPEYLSLLNKINKFETKSLVKSSQILRGNTPKEYGDFKVPIIRSGDLSYSFINGNLLRAENKDIFFVKNKDILISSIGLGSIGKVNIFTGENDRFGTVAEVTIIRNSNINPYYIWAFLCSKYGQFQIEREITGATGQLHLNTGNVANITIPLINDLSVYEKIFKEAEELFNTSKSFYSQAENLLLEELGLKDFKFKDDLFFIVNSSKAKERIDADYFQPKYEQLIEKLKLFKAKKLEDYISNYSTGFTFKSENYQEEGIPLIRINNIKKGLIDLSDTAYLSEKDFSLSPKDEAKPGDIVLSMSGSIGLTAMIPPEIPKCSVNQRILKFTSKNINKEYLVLVLNSIIGNLQLERIGTGGVQTNISYNDIKNVLIPELETDTQQKIAELVKKSHEARKKSKELLEEAKRRVEEMIEKRN